MDAAWSGARAVVTGAAGYLGAHLVDHLAGGGAAVTGIDRDPAGAAGAQLRIDLGHSEADPAARSVLRDADVVFHLAGTGTAGDVGTDAPRLGRLLEAVGQAVGRRISVEEGAGSLPVPADTCADTERLAALIGRVPETDLDDLVRAQAGAPGRTCTRRS